MHMLDKTQNKVFKNDHNIKPQNYEPYYKSKNLITRGKNKMLCILCKLLKLRTKLQCCARYVHCDVVHIVHVVIVFHIVHVVQIQYHVVILYILWDCTNFETICDVLFIMQVGHLKPICDVMNIVHIIFIHIVNVLILFMLSKLCFYKSTECMLSKYCSFVFLIIKIIFTSI